MPSLAQVIIGWTLRYGAAISVKEGDEDIDGDADGNRFNDSVGLWGGGGAGGRKTTIRGDGEVWGAISILSKSLKELLGIE